MKKITFLKLLLLSVVMLVGSGNVLAAVGDVVYTLPGGTGQPFGSSNTYALKTGTYNSVSWTATLGSCQNATTFWLGSNSSQKAKLTLGTTYAAVGTPCGIGAADTYVSALIAGSEFTNVGKVTVANTATGGSAASAITVYVVYSTNSGTSYSLAAASQTAVSAGTLTYEFTTIPSARYAIVAKGANDYTLRVPVVTFYEGVTGGAPVAVSPTFDLPAGTYYSTQNVTLSSATEGATIYYTTDGSDPDNTDTQYSTPVEVSTTTTIKAIAYKTDMDPSSIASATYTFPTINSVSNVAALRAGTTDGTVYKLTSEAVLTLKTANRNAKYIQDATGGILIDDASSKIITTYNLGDGITGIIGTLTIFNGMLQFVPVADPGAATTTGNSVTPVAIELANLANYQGQLVKVSGVVIDGTGNFAASTSYNLNSSSTTVLRTAYTDLPYISTQAIPTVPQDIVGVVLISNLVAQLVPRTIDDFSNTVFSSPTILVSESPVPAMTAQVGVTDTETITVSAQNLESIISLVISGTDASLFKLSTNSIAPTSGIVTDQSVTITYTPTAAGSHTALLTLASDGATNVTRELSGSATWPPLAAPVADAAGAISQSGFTAIWGAVSGATEYELSVYTKEESGGSATDLFISEYIEGSSNNKYIEIFNGTGTTVDLSDYRLQLFSNGASSPSPNNQLSGIIADGEVVVYKNSSAALTLPDGVTAESNTAVAFSGDDAIALFKISTNSYVDIFGIIGSDPGSAWTADGGYSTAEKTLVRKSTIKTGITENPESGFPTLATEWDVFDQNTVANLGSHTFAGGGFSQTEISGSPFTVTDGTSKAITGLTPSTTYYYTVKAKNTNVTSEASNEVSVVTSIGTSTDNPTLTNIYAHNAKIHFAATAGEKVEVYNAVGQKIISTLATDGQNELSVNAKGVMIVKVGSRLAKVIL